MGYAVCIECEEEFAIARKRLGYDTCLECGEVAANKERVRRSKCVAPAYNKGAYMYITDVAMARHIGI